MNPIDGGDRRWLKRFGRRTGLAELRLLCFHHAGGSAAMYRKWPSQMPPFIETIGVQLPGRADRFNEPAYDRMGPLVDDLVEVIKPLLDRPFACYGVSMGAKVAWTLAHALRERSMPMPRMLFVAACPAPNFEEWDEGLENDLERFVRELGGTPAEVLAEPGLLNVLLPTMRADVAVLTTHHLSPDGPLDVRIRAFAGAEDSTAPAERMSHWRTQTSVQFDLDVIPGGHFFDPDGERQVIQTIGRDLGRLLPR